MLSFKWSLSLREETLSSSSTCSLVPLFFLPLEWYHLHTWSCCYLSWKSWSQLVIYPAWHLAFMLSKQGGNIRLWCTSFPILNQTVVPYLILTVASWPAYRFLRRLVKWSGILISLRICPQFDVIHTVKGFNVIREAEIDFFFPGIPLLLLYPTDVVHLLMLGMDDQPKATSVFPV